MLTLRVLFAQEGLAELLLTRSVLLECLGQAAAKAPLSDLMLVR